MQREDVPAPLQGTGSEDEGRGIALVLEIETETDAEVAHGRLTGGVQGGFLEYIEYSGLLVAVSFVSTIPPKSN